MRLTASPACFPPDCSVENRGHWGIRPRNAFPSPPSDTTVSYMEPRR